MTTPQLEPSDLLRMLVRARLHDDPEAVTAVLEHATAAELRAALHRTVSVIHDAIAQAVGHDPALGQLLDALLTA